METLGQKSIESEIEALVRHICGTKRGLSSETELYHDLSIAGDDASELLDTVCTKYGTSFEAFEFDAHFPNETEAALYWMKKCLGLRDKRRKSFSFGHLVAVVGVGKWFESTNSSGAVAAPRSDSSRRRSAHHD